MPVGYNDNKINCITKLETIKSTCPKGYKDMGNSVRRSRPRWGRSRGEDTERF